ncbi:MAG: ribosome maturation factor [Denitrovibrio sp.]|nr:MAG: ribosome maturation factor [Denitrovibrio sp.]
MKRSNKYITDKIRPYILKALEEKGLDLFELTLRSERGGVVLRITIDKPEGPGIEDCTIASRAVSEFLDSDESNIPFDRYNLEVSTPGLERPLRSESDFKRFIGKKCKITNREKDKTGRKSYTGIIE